MFPLLETLVAVVEIGQFTLAADELKVSQPTVSSRIAQLERVVGAPLFERHAKGDVTPTEAGLLLYRAATGIGDSWREACEQIAASRERREPFLALFSHTASEVLLPSALACGANGLAQFDLRTATLNSDAILERTGIKAAQLGIVEKPIVNESVSRVTLREDRLVWAGAQGDVWLVREHGSGVRYYTDLFFKTCDRTPAHSIEVASNAAIVATLAAGFGQSIVSQAAVPEHVPTRELSGEFVRRFYALIPRSGLSRAQRVLAHTMVDAMRG
ncbi:LysR family transcriptional regulator [Bifidobacterium sp.]|jgi:DNA-binding transcriptional LysR family regulator|uniref:LysR family transcriptional regulator n=1 Tax=Bifidobacterium sp. TaxID=41200 RepID=UPI0025BB85CA|nr:LysR family transcriptional regulator [Bifidobacterium sp.]MCH4209707.1 LysR family transcriptional regulator [Bifidobacterium sp.]MCI1224523.1 LysR family transcriptional regulator [Bifidobacterium sp.]